MRATLTTAALAAGLGLVLGLWGPGAAARPEYQTQFRRVYEAAKRSELSKASCMLCHQKRRGGTKLNPYGEDLRKASRKLKREYRKKRKELPKWDPERGGLGLYQRAAYRAVEKLDSDGDKADNAWEIKHDKLPGQNWSVPSKLPKKPKAEEEDEQTEEEGAEESEGEQGESEEGQGAGENEDEGEEDQPDDSQ